MRTIVDLPEEQIAQLAALADEKTLSRAELVRRAVAEYLRTHYRQNEDEAFGLWKQRDINSLDYENALRNEWES